MSCEIEGEDLGLLLSSSEFVAILAVGGRAVEVVPLLRWSGRVKGESA